MWESTLMHKRKLFWPFPHCYHSMDPLEYVSSDFPRFYFDSVHRLIGTMKKAVFILCAMSLHWHMYHPAGALCATIYVKSNRSKRRGRFSMFGLLTC